MKIARGAAALGACVVSLLILSSSAFGATTRPLPIADVAPADGTQLAPSSTGVPISVSIDRSNLEFAPDVYVAVSTSNAVGPDGRLPSDGGIDFFMLDNPTVSSGFYSGTSHPGNWGSTPGTYYWQISDSYNCPHLTFPNEDCGPYVSPVYTLTILPPLTAESSLALTQEYARVACEGDRKCRKYSATNCVAAEAGFTCVAKEFTIRRGRKFVCSQTVYWSNVTGTVVSEARTNFTCRAKRWR